MNLLRALLSPFDRRNEDRPVQEEKRASKYDRIKAANGRINSAIEDLDRTVSMTRQEFCELIQREGDCPRDKK